MNCAYCGTPLPAGALFCVECGRSVADPVPVAPARAPAAAPAPHDALHAPHCPQCGSAIEEGDIFCGECGFVLRPFTASIAVPDAAREPEAEPESEPEAEREPEPEAERGPDAEREPEGAVLIDDELVDWGDEDSDAPGTAFLEPPRPVEPDAASAAPSPPAAEHALEDIESTRIVAQRARGERYVLQFSTGESVVVTGTGLVGRNPSPEPGEYVDELVAIFDVGKSVSKSHVEFGQEAGRFWIADRYSTNGTVIRQPDGPPVRCDPGKRYLVARGSRVEIGEQFFVVS